MASAGATIWLPDTERFFGELSVIITRAQQQRNLTAAQFGTSEFFVRRLEEYERTLCVLTSRIEESCEQEICFIGHLHQLLGILNELRCHFEGIAEEAERDIDSFEELATPAIVSTARHEGVGRPRLALAQEQLETLHGEAGFPWADVGIVARSRCQVIGVIRVAVKFRCCCALVIMTLNSPKNLSVSGSQIVAPADAILYLLPKIFAGPWYQMTSLPVL